MGRTKYVDIDGKTITGIGTWRKKHPNKMYFDSNLERVVYMKLVKAGLKVELKPEPIILTPSFKTVELAYNKELKSIRQSSLLKAKTRKEKTAATRNFNLNNEKSIEEFLSKPMTWSIDYLLPEFNLYVEAKGHPNEAFPNKLKLARYLLAQKGYKVIVVTTQKDCDDLIKHLIK